MSILEEYNAFLDQVRRGPSSAAAPTQNQPDHSASALPLTSPSILNDESPSPASSSAVTAAQASSSSSKKNTDARAEADIGHKDGTDCNDTPSKSPLPQGSTKKGTAPYDTLVPRIIKLGDLVWAKNYRCNNAYFCGRLCDPIEGICQRNVPPPGLFSQDERLVQLFCVAEEFDIVRAVDVLAFNDQPKRLRFSRKDLKMKSFYFEDGCQMQGSDIGKELEQGRVVGAREREEAYSELPGVADDCCWNEDRLFTMALKLGEKMSQKKAKKIFDAVRAKAQEFLEAALQRDQRIRKSEAIFSSSSSAVADDGKEADGEEGAAAGASRDSAKTKTPPRDALTSAWQPPATLAPEEMRVGDFLAYTSDNGYEVCSEILSFTEDAKVPVQLRSRDPIDHRQPVCRHVHDRLTGRCGVGYRSRTDMGDRVHILNAKRDAGRVLADGRVESGVFGADWAWWKEGEAFSVAAPKWRDLREYIFPPGTAAARYKHTPAPRSSSASGKTGNAPSKKSRKSAKTTAIVQSTCDEKQGKSAKKSKTSNQEDKLMSEEADEEEVEGGSSVDAVVGTKLIDLALSQSSSSVSSVTSRRLAPAATIAAASAPAAATPSESRKDRRIRREKQARLEGGDGTGMGAAADGAVDAVDGVACEKKDSSSVQQQGKKGKEGKRRRASDEQKDTLCSESKARGVIPYSQEKKQDEEEKKAKRRGRKEKDGKKRVRQGKGEMERKENPLRAGKRDDIKETADDVVDAGGSDPCAATVAVTACKRGTGEKDDSGEEVESSRLTNSSRKRKQEKDSAPAGSEGPYGQEEEAAGKTDVGSHSKRRKKRPAAAAAAEVGSDQSRHGASDGCNGCIHGEGEGEGIGVGMAAAEFAASGTSGGLSRKAKRERHMGSSNQGKEKAGDGEGQRQEVGGGEGEVEMDLDLPESGVLKARRLLKGRNGSDAAAAAAAPPFSISSTPAPLSTRPVFEAESESALTLVPTPTPVPEASAARRRGAVDNMAVLTQRASSVPGSASHREKGSGPLDGSKEEGSEKKKKVKAGAIAGAGGCREGGRFSRTPRMADPLSAMKSVGKMGTHIRFPDSPMPQAPREDDIEEGEEGVEKRDRVDRSLW